MAARCIGLVGMFVLSAVAASAQPAPTESFGLVDQELHVGAIEFRPQDSSVQYSFDDPQGYLRPAGTTSAIWVAPFHLPDGAQLYQVCLYAYDASPYVVNLNVVGYRMAYGGQTSGYFSVGPGFSTDWDFGYGVKCADFNYTYRDTLDFNNDGLPDHVAYYLRVAIGSGVSGANLGLGGVRLLWRRQVSPDPGFATFSDVPVGHPFHRFVEALYAAGITAGYGDGRFGVNDPVTRGQMAKFLAVALGLHWAN